MSSKCELLRKWALNLAVMLIKKRVSSCPKVYCGMAIFYSHQPDKFLCCFSLAWARLSAGVSWRNVYRSEMLLPSCSWQENWKRERAAVPVEEEHFSCIFRCIIYWNIVLLSAGATLHCPSALATSAEGLCLSLALVTLVNECWKLLKVRSHVLVLI